MIAVGQKISQYIIVSAVGSGGMGKVFLADDEQLGRKAALKFLAPELSSEAEHMERFFREARAASALNHPNICTIYEINASSNPPYIAMEYVEGETVAQMIRRRRRTVRETLEISCQIADALTEAHIQGVIHRDIKPANIIVTNRGLVKVLDFGLAKKVASYDRFPQDQFETNAGTILGTASYMSPEQTRGIGVDHRTDIWSLGVCMYEMLTGKPPFSRETPADTFAAILNGEMVLPSQIFPDIPKRIDELISKTLAKDTDNRYNSAQDLLNDIRVLLKGLDRDGLLNSPDEKMSQPDEATEVLRLSTGTLSGAASDPDEEASSARPNNLTATYSRIIGREKELNALAGMLTQKDIRLITMTGIGGTGKTALSRAVARKMLSHFDDGVFFVEMASVFEPEVMIPTIALPLGLKEEAGVSMLDTLADHLQNKRILLVIDNFEQVIKAAPYLSDLLNKCPFLKILVTSRELLNITHETEFAVPPLNIPDASDTVGLDELLKNDALMLFTERARSVKPGFALTPENIKDTASICSKLEGLPLAIELAAARVKVLSPKTLLAKLENRLTFLTGGARDLPERQQTMRAAVLWSYELLNDEERDAFRKLAVFSGGFRLAAAEAVLRNEDAGSSEAIDLISSLVDKSLLLQREQFDHEPRFRMLEVVRDFALEELAKAGDEIGSRHAHAEFFLTLCETAEPFLHSAESEAWLKKLAEEHDNIRSAMAWSLKNEPEMAVRLAVGARNYWLVHSHLTEGFGWLKAATETGFTPEPSLRFKLLNGLGLAARFQGDLETARKAYVSGLEAGTEAKNDPGIALSNRGLGLVAMQKGETEAAKGHFDAGLAISRKLDDKFGIAISLSFLGDLARTLNRYSEAVPQFEEAVQLFRELENRAALSDSLNNLGAAKLCLGRTVEAASHFSEALSSANTMANRITISCSLDGFAAVALETGDIERSAMLAGASAALRDVIGYKIEPAERNFRDLYMAKLAAAADKDLEDIMAEGAKLSIDAAIESAFETARHVEVTLHDNPIPKAK